MTARVDNGGIKAVVFDLFDTLVKWEPERLPLFALARAFHPQHVAVDIAVARGADGRRASNSRRSSTVYHDVIDEINAEREREGIEITCQQRFVRTLERLGYARPGGARPAGRSM